MLVEPYIYARPTPGDNLGYVTFFTDRADGVIVIDPVSRVVVRKLPVPWASSLVVSPDRRYVYVGAGDGVNSLHRFDTKDFTSTKVSFDGSPIGMVISPDGQFVYTTCQEGFVRKFSLAAGVGPKIPFGVQGWGIVMSPDGQSVYVSDRISGKVVEISTATDTAVTPAIDPGIPSPGSMAITPDGAFIYVVNEGELRTVSVIDTAAKRHVATIAVDPSLAGREVLDEIAVTLDGMRVYVVSEQSVYMIDVATNTVTDKISIGFRVDGMGVTPDNRFVYVTPELETMGGGRAAVIDTATNAVVSSVDLMLPKVGTGIGAEFMVFGPTYQTELSLNQYIAIADAGSLAVATELGSFAPKVGSFPVGVAVAPDGRRAYVTNRDDDSVSVVGLLENVTVSPAIKLASGDRPLGIAISPDSTIAYVANSGANTMSRIDTRTALPIGPALPVGGYPVKVAIDRVHTGLVYVTNFGSSSLSVFDPAKPAMAPREIKDASLHGPFGLALNPPFFGLYVCNTLSGTISVFDSRTLALIAVYDIGGLPLGIAISPDGKRLYVTNAGDGKLYVVDALTGTLLPAGPIAVGRFPFGVALSPDGLFVHVTSAGSRTVSVFDAATLVPQGPPRVLADRPGEVAVARVWTPVVV